MRRFFRILSGLTVLLATIVVGVGAYRAWAATHPPFTKGQDKAASYHVSRDTMFDCLNIGVDWQISERELAATLSQAADDHMNKPRVGFIFTHYMIVNAYLIKDGKSGKTFVGSLRRYLPPKNSEERDEIDWEAVLLGEHDSFSINLEAARHDFN